jgi:hypothetical protein
MYFFPDQHEGFPSSKQAPKIPEGISGVFIFIFSDRIDLPGINPDSTTQI